MDSTYGRVESCESREQRLTSTTWWTVQSAGSSVSMPGGTGALKYGLRLPRCSCTLKAVLRASSCDTLAHDANATRGRSVKNEANIVVSWVDRGKTDGWQRSRGPRAHPGLFFLQYIRTGGLIGQTQPPTCASRSDQSLTLVALGTKLIPTTAPTSFHVETHDVRVWPCCVGPRGVADQPVGALSASREHKGLSGLVCRLQD